jgi:RNA polymerase primary sigma factor
LSNENPQFKWGQRDGMTLDEIAKHFGLTRERIRQIEAKALRKIRNKLRARGLTFKDFIQSFKD